MFSGDMFNAGSILTYPMVEEEKEAWKKLAAAAFSVANTSAVTTTDTTIKNTAM
jgi:hypothetical protein